MLLTAQQLNSSQISEILKIKSPTVRQIKKRIKDNKFGRIFTKHSIQRK